MKELKNKEREDLPRYNKVLGKLMLFESNLDLFIQLIIRLLVIFKVRFVNLFVFIEVLFGKLELSLIKLFDFPDVLAKRGDLKRIFSLVFFVFLIYFVLSGINTQVRAQFADGVACSYDSQCNSGNCDNETLIGLGADTGSGGDVKLCFSINDCLGVGPAACGDGYTNPNGNCQNDSGIISEACDDIPPLGCPSQGTYCSGSCISSDRDSSETACIATGWGCTTYNWSIGGETAQTNCCGDDGSENALIQNASLTMDNNFLTNTSQDACCIASTDCVNISGGCYDSGTTTHDADADGDTDYCYLGEWLDCSTSAQCGGACYYDNDCEVELNITEILTPSVTSPTSTILLTGFVNDSNGNGVPNNLISFYINKSLIEIIEGWNFDTSGWWDTSWRFRKEITISSVGTETLTDFPAYLNITYDPHMQVDYDDLRFLNGSCGGETGDPLEFELEKGSGTNAEVWIKIPSLRTSGETICMYYNNSDATSNQNITGVWDTSYTSIYHLNHTSGAAIDTKSNFDAEDFIDPDSNMDVNGIVGNGDYFDGSDYLGTNPEWNVDGAHTYCVWIKWTSLHDGTILEDGGNTDGTGLGVLSTGEVRYAEMFDTASNYLDSSTTYNDGSWHYVCGGHTGTDQFLYVDDRLISQVTQGDGLSGSDDARIGQMAGTQNPVFGDANAHALDATLDEIRVSSTDRSVSWMNQSYQMVANQATIVTFTEKSIMTNATGYYNYTFVAPSNLGIYQVIANATYNGDYGEVTQLLTVTAGPDLLNLTVDASSFKPTQQATFTSNWDCDDCSYVKLLIDDDIGFSSCDYDTASGCLCNSSGESNSVSSCTYTFGGGDIGNFVWYGRICSSDDFCDNTVKYEYYYLEKENAFEKNGSAVDPWDYDNEANVTEYGEINLSDDVRWRTWYYDQDTVDGDTFDSQIFTFNITEIQPPNITPYWEGYGEKNSTGFYTNLSIWNWSNYEWYRLDGKDFTTTTDDILTSTISTGATDFINSTINQIVFRIITRRYIP